MARRAFSTSPKKYYDDVSQLATSVRDILRNETLTLSEMRRLDGAELTKIITRIIGSTLEYFGLDKYEASNESMGILITNIIEKYYYFTLPDIILCMKKATRGEFGEFYGRVDLSKIMGWFRKYDDLRSSGVHQVQPPQTDYSELPRAMEEHWEDERKKAEGGDEEARKNVEAHERLKEKFKSLRSQSELYNYNRKHKFDKQRLEDEKKWQEERNPNLGK